MGLRITNYSVLRLLTDPSAVTCNEERALARLIHEFRAVAVILHDPVRHAGLDRVLHDRFEHLDRVTGSKLLFMTLLSGARTVLTERQGLGGLAQRLGDQKFKGHAYTTVSDEPELSLLAGSSALGIPSTDLPCVVVFRGGHGAAREYCWFRTSATTVERQLERLALAANEMEPPPPAWMSARPVVAFREHFGAALRAMSDRWRENFFYTPHPLADHLAGFDLELVPAWGVVPEGPDVATRLALALAPLAGTHEEGERARQAQSAELERLLAHAEPRSDEYARAVAECALQLGITIALLKAKNTAVEWPWPAPECWEVEAAASLRTAMKLRALNDDDLVTLAVLCYGRAFEAEVNASVVNELRLRHRLTENDRLPSPLLVGVWSDGRHYQVDLNMRRAGRWVPPGLGQSEAVAGQFGPPDDGFSPEAWHLLLREWAVLRRQRNAVAHPRTGHALDRPDRNRPNVEACETAFRTLHEKQVLAALFALKARVRGQDPR